MTRILVQRGSGSSSSNQSRSSLPGPSTVPSHTSSHDSVKEEEQQEIQDIGELGSVLNFSGQCNSQASRKDDSCESPGAPSENVEKGDFGANDSMNFANMPRGLNEINISEQDAIDGTNISSSHILTCSPHPPPPPVPPPRHSNLGPRKQSFNNLGVLRNGSSRRIGCWSIVPVPSDSRPSSPRSFSEAEGYNSADEQGHCFGSYDDYEKERQFELEIRLVNGLEVKRMTEDGNCLFRAVADQVYGDTESYDVIRQMCIDYMERERDHFSQFVTEGFASYCKRKRRDKVYGNNLEIQALSEMYNRPIHIYSYGTEPINIFHGNYNTDMPPIRLSYHRGNHYNSLVDPRGSNIGAGLGFHCLKGSNVNKDQVKAAIKAQQDQQLDRALLAEGQFYSDLELTEKEIERMVMETSRVEYFTGNKSKRLIGGTEATSGAEPSSSGGTKVLTRSRNHGLGETCAATTASNNLEVLLSMGFSYLQVAEAHSIFGDDIDSIICYLLDMDGANSEICSLNQWKGKAAE